MMRRSLAGRILSWLLPLLALAVVLPVLLSHWIGDAVGAGLAAAIIVQPLACGL